MVSILKKRLAREEKGFTLIELLVVIIIIGILLAIAVPSYLTFRDQAEDTTAKANVRAALPAAEAYAGANGGYDLMDRAALLTYDAGIAPDVLVVAPSATGYCIEAGTADDVFHYSVGNAALGTQGSVQPGACA